MSQCYGEKANDRRKPLISLAATQGAHRRAGGEKVPRGSIIRTPAIEKNPFRFNDFAPKFESWRIFLPFSNDLRHVAGKNLTFSIDIDCL
jgi:hypothetical protein